MVGWDMADGYAYFRLYRLAAWRVTFHSLLVCTAVLVLAAVSELA